MGSICSSSFDPPSLSRSSSEPIIPSVFFQMCVCVCPNGSAVVALAPSLRGFQLLVSCQRHRLNSYLTSHDIILSPHPLAFAFSVSLFAPFSLSVSLSFLHSLSLSVTLSQFSLSVSLFPKIPLSVSLSLSICLYLFVYLSLSLRLSVCLSLSICLSFSLARPHCKP